MPLPDYMPMKDMRANQSQPQQRGNSNNNDDDDDDDGIKFIKPQTRLTDQEVASGYAVSNFSLREQVCLF